MYLETDHPLQAYELVDKLDQELRKENSCHINRKQPEELTLLSMCAAMKRLLQDILYYCEKHDRDTYLEVVHLIIGRIRVSKTSIEMAQRESAIK
jgi:tRNA C32,U32 (ribose-2'-O)-methylase TrmJ